MSKPFLPKPAKVVAMTEEKRSVIATDEKSRRFILAIGKQRIAFDFLTRVTELPPRTGDQPAPVLPIEKQKSGIQTTAPKTSGRTTRPKTGGS
jgi:hypothetical protein